MVFHAPWESVSSTFYADFFAAYPGFSVHCPKLSARAPENDQKWGYRAAGLHPYLILDTRYEKVRKEGVIGSRAVLVAIGINEDGRRCVLAVELANRQSESSWKDFIGQLRKRGLRGVEYVVSDDHAGLRKAIAESLTEAAWQRCYVHSLRNALDYLPRGKPMTIA